MIFNDICIFSHVYMTEICFQSVQMSSVYPDSYRDRLIRKIRVLFFFTNTTFYFAHYLNYIFNHKKFI